jgi:hypothetical protein
MCPILRWPVDTIPTAEPATALRHEHMGTARPRSVNAPYTSSCNRSETGSVTALERLETPRGVAGPLRLRRTEGIYPKPIAPNSNRHLSLAVQFRQVVVQKCEPKIESIQQERVRMRLDLDNPSEQTTCPPLSFCDQKVVSIYRRHESV